MTIEFVYYAQDTPLQNHRIIYDDASWPPSCCTIIILLLRKGELMKNTPLSAKRRRLLFELWEQCGNAVEACRQVDVSQGTFYYWKPRFEQGGYAALDKTLSHAPKKPRRISPVLESKIVELKRHNPTWGKERIAKTISLSAKDNLSVSANTVRRVLIEAGLWHTHQ